MANLSLTAANVAPVSDMRVVTGYAAVAIAAGEVGYYDSTAGGYKLADTDLAGAQSPIGIAINSAGVGQAVTWALPGSVIAIGGTVAKGVAYYLSATAGKIAPFADLTTGAKPVIVGIGVSTTEIKVVMAESGATL